MTASSVANQKEGGVVKATLTASAVVVNAEVSYTLTFDRWCLGCSLMFKVKTATGDYKTKYPGTAESTPTAKVNLYIVIHSAVASRVLAFRYGTSPWASYWQKYDATTVAANLPSTVKPKQTIEAMGATAVDAVRSFIFFSSTLLPTRTP